MMGGGWEKLCWEWVTKKKKESLSLTYDPHVKKISIVRHDNIRSLKKKDGLSLTYDRHVKMISIVRDDVRSPQKKR